MRNAGSPRQERDRLRPAFATRSLFVSLVSLLARVLGIALLMGGVVATTVWPSAIGGVECCAEGDAEVPLDIEVEEEKLTQDRRRSVAPEDGAAPYASDQAVVVSVPFGAPPTPPPEA